MTNCQFIKTFPLFFLEISKYFAMFLFFWLLIPSVIMSFFSPQIIKSFISRVPPHSDTYTHFCLAPTVASENSASSVPARPEWMTVSFALPRVTNHADCREKNKARDPRCKQRRTPLQNLKRIAWFYHSYVLVSYIQVCDTFFKINITSAVQV